MYANTLYAARLQTLQVGERKHSDSDPAPLSQRIRNCEKRGAWMVNYAARKAREYVFIYWKFLDVAYGFGHNEDQDHHVRVGRLAADEVESMEGFVRMEMENARERTVAAWDHESAHALLGRMWPKEG